VCHPKPAWRPEKGEVVVDENILRGKWNQLKGEVKQQWGEFTDDELDQIEGRRDKLVGMLQEKYGYSRERAEDEVDDFFSAYED
jgi:uncharacterized protein YjbJ (UPF0337 family)